MFLMVLDQGVSPLIEKLVAVKRGINTLMVGTLVNLALLSAILLMNLHLGNMVA